MIGSDNSMIRRETVDQGIIAEVVEARSTGAPEELMFQNIQERVHGEEVSKDDHFVTSAALDSMVKICAQEDSRLYCGQPPVSV